MRKGQGCPIPPVRRYFLRLHGMHCQGVSGGADSAHCSVARGNCQLASRSINFGRKTVLPLPLAGGVAGVTKPGDHAGWKLWLRGEVRVEWGGEFKERKPI